MCNTIKIRDYFILLKNKISIAGNEVHDLKKEINGRACFLFAFPWKMASKSQLCKDKQHKLPFKSHC